MPPSQLSLRLRRALARQHLYRRLIGLGLVIIVFGVVAGSDLLHRYADSVIVWCEGVIAVRPYLGMAVFTVLAMLSAMVAFFSSAVFVPIAIFAWGKTITFALLWCGWLLGGAASFGIGRLLGRRAAAWVVGEDTIARWQSQFDQRSRFVHVLLFQALVPSEIPGYVLGLLRYRFSYYLIALAITELPYVFGVVFLGERFLQGQGVFILFFGLAVLLLGLLLLGLRGARRDRD